MNEPIFEQLLALGKVLHWFGRFDEMQAVTAFALWLRENDIRKWQDAVELMEGSNDNPNIKPLPAPSYGIRS